MPKRPGDPLAMTGRHKTEAEHNAELEAFQKNLDSQERFFTNLAESDAEESGHTDVANHVTRRAPKRPTLDEQDGDPNE